MNEGALKNVIVEYMDGRKRTVKKCICVDLVNAGSDEVKFMISPDVSGQEIVKTVLSFVYLLDELGLKDSFLNRVKE